MCVGVVVYTGSETKMALNSAGKRIKRSQIERQLNCFLVVFLVLMAAWSLGCTALEYIFQSFSQIRYAHYAPLLRPFSVCSPL